MLLRLRSKKKLIFEKELYNTINNRLLQSPMTFEMVKLLALRLQNSDEFKSDESVKKMKFTIVMVTVPGTVRH